MKAQTPIVCYSQVKTRNWCQEWYETAARHAILRTNQVKKAGFAAKSQAMGTVVTRQGLLKLTLVDIRPATNTDFETLPAVRIEQL